MEKQEIEHLVKAINNGNKNWNVPSILAIVLPIITIICTVLLAGKAIGIYNMKVESLDRDLCTLKEQGSEPAIQNKIEVAVIKSKIEGIDGTVVKIKRDGNNKEMDFRFVAITALVEPRKGEDSLKADDKVKYFNLATRIQNAKTEVELDIKEMNLILDRLSSCNLGTVMIYGQVNKMLNKKKGAEDGKKGT